MAKHILPSGFEDFSLEILNFPEVKAAIDSGAILMPRLVEILLLFETLADELLLSQEFQLLVKKAPADNSWSSLALSYLRTEISFNFVKALWATQLVRRLESSELSDLEQFSISGLRDSSQRKPH